MRGLMLRICLIVAAALVLFLLVSFTAYYAQRIDNPRGLYLPVPAQIAAIVETVETTPPERLPLLLHALSSNMMQVSVVDMPPSSAETRSMPMFTRMVRRYLRELGGRPVRAMVDLSGDGDVAIDESNGRMLTTHPIRLVIGLKTGRTLVVELRNEYLVRMTGFRLALAVLLATLAIGAISLWAVRRQIRPIEKLAEAVDSFGTRLDVPPLKEEGASEVRRLIVATNRMQTRIRDLVGSRTRMMAAIGHDLGTYLTRLRLRAEFIGDETQRERAVRDIEEMHALMNDTLTLAKLENDSEPSSAVDLVALARRCVEGFAVSGAPVRLLASDAPVVIRARETAIKRALTNLISNALKYGQEADVTISQAGLSARLVVEDRGPGIPAHEREAVLEPFYRQDAARNLDAGGFGLGLAIVADIVHRHNGTITLGDRPGGGLSVSVELPLADQAASVTTPLAAR
jgi:signal transduction histidine kinase